MPKAPGLRARDPSAPNHFMNVQENKLSEVSHSGQKMQAPSLRQQQGPSWRTSALAEANQLAPSSRGVPFRKRRPHHSETVGPWVTDQACGPRPCLLAVGIHKRPAPQALLFSCGEGAACEAWQLEERGRGPQARSVPQALFVRFGGWKTSQSASCLVGSDSDVRHWRPLPVGPVLPSGPCYFGVAKRRL